ncbi:hypothetical protein [Streptomyces canus]|uniref:hypothetical protein n=1 Tax=Streptomyces canus TaxID=58343 RepID=UPI00036CBC41|nr:hypothetical protein [Streptomyces canus]
MTVVPVRLEAMKESREREESDAMSTLIDRQPRGAERVSAVPPGRRRHRTEHVLVGCGLVLLPWLFVPTAALPATAVAANWRTVWIGLDSSEAVGLIATGLLARRRHHLHPLTAVATATLLVVDAWFDTLMAAPGADRVSAVAMALGAELPPAVMCVVLAARGHARAAG